MKKEVRRLLFLLVSLALLFTVSCMKDAGDPEFEIMLSYMNSNGMTFSELFEDWKMPADTLEAYMEDYYVFDLRGSDKDDDGVIEYDEGHISGAVLVNFDNLLDTAESYTDKPIVVVCFTGQSAGHAVMALRLSGYSDAKVLLWGMSSWHSGFDSWSGNTGDMAIGHSNWVPASGEITASKKFDKPNLGTSEESGASILAKRVDMMLDEGFMGIEASNVLASPEDYFINNFWAATDVKQYGNIRTAYRLNPLDIENLNPDEIIVTYCWSGQTSSMITAYLNVLGYDAKSLKFGANGMIYSNLLSHKWAAPTVDKEIEP